MKNKRSGRPPKLERNIAILHLRQLGYSHEKIGKIFGMKKPTVFKILHTQHILELSTAEGLAKS